MESSAKDGNGPGSVAPSSRAHEDVESNTHLSDNTKGADARPECFQSTVQEILFVASATMAIGMTAILSGSITVTSSFIGRSLNMTTAEITWLFSSSSLSSGAFLLFFGMVADLFGALHYNMNGPDPFLTSFTGRKLMFVTSMFLFVVFCLAAGFSQNGITIDILNGVLGLFSASAVPPAVGLLGVIYNKPGRRKNAAFASFAAGNPLGFVCGTIFGGIAANLFGWRAPFWLIAIIFSFFTVVAIFCVPSDTSDKQPLSWDTLKRFDVVGTLLTICGIGMFSAALSLGDTAPNGWKTAYVLVLLIVGLLLIIAFVFWELRFEWPLMPMGIWKDRNFTLVLSILMLGCMSFTPTSFFMALYFQDVWQKSALMVAVYLLPMAVNGVIVNIFAGVFLHRISNKVLMLVGATAYAVANLLFALNTVDSSYWAFCFPGFVILVIGADLEFNVANMYVMSSMPASQQSLAGGIFQTVTKLCMTIGFGVATVVFDSVGARPSLSSYWDKPTQPYAAVFWTSFTFATLSIFLVPFLTIGTQGGKDESIVDDDTTQSIESEKDCTVLAEPVTDAGLPTSQRPTPADGLTNTP